MPVAIIETVVPAVKVWPLPIVTPPGPVNVREPPALMVCAVVIPVNETEPEPLAVKLTEPGVEIDEFPVIPIAVPVEFALMETLPEAVLLMAASCMVTVLVESVNI